MKLTCLEDFPADLHPLNVLVCKPQWDRFFSDTSGCSCVLLLSCIEAQYSTKSEVLVCARITGEEEEEEVTGCTGVGRNRSSSSVIVYVSQNFLDRHDLTEETSGTVRIMKPLPLSRVVIGARTKQSFRWASSDEFSSFLLLLASCPGQIPLVKKGDFLILSHHPSLGRDATQVYNYLSDLMVLDCAPVCQGTITVNTSVIISDCRDLWHNPGTDSNPNLTHKSLFVSDFAHYANSLGPGCSLLSNIHLLGSGMAGILQALECRLDVRVAFHSATRNSLVKFAIKGNRDAKVDPDGAIFMSQNLLLKLGLFHHEWVVCAVGRPDKIKDSSGAEGLQRSLSENDNGSRISVGGDGRLVRIVAFNIDGFSDVDVSDDTGYISPVLWFNLSNREAAPIRSKAVKIKVSTLLNYIFITYISLLFINTNSLLISG